MMFLKTVIVSATILVGISTLVSSQSNRPRTLPSFCEGEKCVTLPTKRIYKIYKNLLLTKEEIQKKLDVWAMNRKERFGQSGAGSFFTALCRNPFFERQQFCRNWKESNQDYDLCCPTQIHHKSSNILNNTKNKTRVLVKLQNPLREQFIPEATCLSSGACFKGVGTCRVDTISVWLLVYNIFLPSLYCEFDEFEIPAYCSCKTKQSGN